MRKCWVSTRRAGFGKRLFIVCDRFIAGLSIKSPVAKALRYSAELKENTP